MISKEADTTNPGEVRNFVWEWHLAVPPGQLWPLVSDTDRVNRLAGLPPVRYRTVLLPDGGSETHGEIRLLGLIPLRYREHPFEWVENLRLSVRRDFDGGPLFSYSSSVELFPESRGTHLVQTISFRLRWPKVAPLLGLVTKNAHKSFDRVYKSFASEPSRSETHPPLSRWQHSVEKKAARLLGQIEPPLDRDLLEKLVHYIATEEGRELRFMRPFAMANRFGHTKEEVLSACLSAVQVGALNLSWNLLCPHCRGAKKQSSSLGEVTPDAFCEACNIDYEVEFDRSLEVTFSPAPALRRMREEIYCVGGPGNTPHVVQQSIIPPKEVHRTTCQLAPGAHRIRCTKSRTYIPILVAEGSNSANQDSMERKVIDLEITADGLQSSVIQVPAGMIEMSYSSSAPDERLVILERTEWADDASTALDVAFFPQFRRIFGPDAVRPGEKIAVQNIALMFTDLKSSTEMYESIGDAVAYGVVREHFDILLDKIREQDGFLIKTIGDAVMASFKTSESAVRAAFAIQKSLAEFNSREGKEPIILKMGIHTGHAIAVNLNGRTDFFGSTVNIAARIQGKREGGDFVITKTVREDPAVGQILSEMPHRTEVFNAGLKGIAEDMQLYRIWLCMENS